MVDTAFRLPSALPPGFNSSPGVAHALAMLLTLFLLLAIAGQPVRAAPSATNPVLDERVNKLASELRCLVCQNQTIADSHAELAVQLKGEVRQQLARGATDDQVRAFMVQRYGDFVLYRPPLNRTTWLLWGTPALLLFFGGWLFWKHWRESQTMLAETPDSQQPYEEPPLAKEPSQK